MSSQDEEELKVYLRGTKFEPTLNRLVKRAENSDARMRNGLSKDDKQRMLEECAPRLHWVLQAECHSAYLQFRLITMVSLDFPMSCPNVMDDRWRSHTADLDIRGQLEKMEQCLSNL